MAVQRIWDGSTWVQVGVSQNEHEGDISSVNTQLAQIMNDWDFGLITSSPTSTDDFGSIK